jgi:cyclophilin family peptidyl-prolyl cis-trans isomerase/HEAT repeat protein
MAVSKHRYFLAGLAGLLGAMALACPKSTPVAVEPTPEDKLARILKLEDERSIGSGELSSHLSDPDGGVRARAVLALGRIGGTDGVAMAALLGDSSPYVRSTAALALGIQEGTIAPEASARLVEALDDPEPRVRGRAAEALVRKTGEESAESIGTALAGRVPQGGEPYDWGEPITESSLTPPHVDVRLPLFALARLKSLRWSWNALATEGRTPRFVWWPAALVASELSGDELQPLHLFYAGSPDPVLRLYGARGLGNLSSDRPRDYVRQLLFDPNEKVRIEAIRAAARLRLAELVPDLLNHLAADSRYVQVEVLSGMKVLASPAAVDPLIDLIGHESDWVRSLALEALARQDPDSFWLLLSGIGSDRSFRARSALTRLLAQTAGARSEAILRQLTRDPDARVRADALLALGSVAGTASVGETIGHLSANDPFERIAAARSLSASGAIEAFAPIEQAFAVERDPDPRVRAALLKTLATIDPERAAPIARQALDDPSYLLRRRAASILSEGGDSGVAVGPRPSERGIEDYRVLLDAPYSPQATLQTAKGAIEIELFIADAPLTVENFVRLARARFFDGTEIYEVIPNGHIAGGDPRGDGNGGPGYTIRSEINARPVVRGTVAMVEAEKDEGGSRFLITHLPAPALEGRATVFGHVVRGMEVVDRLEPGDAIEKVTIWDGVRSPYTDR